MGCMAHTEIIIITEKGEYDCFLSPEATLEKFSVYSVHYSSPYMSQLPTHEKGDR